MKRFSGHPEAWGAFGDVKYWPEITRLKAYTFGAGPDYVTNDDSMTHPFDAPPEQYY